MINHDAKSTQLGERLLEFHVLGPLEILDSGTLCPPGGPKQRTVLALLLAKANRVVTQGELVDELWGSHPPQSASSNVRTYMTRIRKSIPSEHRDRLTFRTHGYSLTVGADELDSNIATNLSERGRAALHAGEPIIATGRLRQARALWRGEVFEDVDHGPVISEFISRVNEVRATLEEDLFAARILTGVGPSDISDLRTFVNSHPFRERGWEMLIQALHQEGNRGEALETYRRAQALFQAELGVNPSPRLRRLHDSVLAGNTTTSMFVEPAHAEYTSALRSGRQDVMI